MKVDKRTLPDRVSHDLPLLLRVTRPDDHLVGLLVVTGARALGRLAPRGHRMTAARGAAFTTAVRNRKSVVSGKSVSVRVDLGGRRLIKKKNKRFKQMRRRHRKEEQRNK